VQTATQSKKWTLVDGPNAVTFEDRGSSMVLRTSFLNYMGRLQRKPNRTMPKEMARQEWRKLVAAGWVEWK
jgi:hypothetical protein